VGNEQRAGLKYHIGPDGSCSVIRNVLVERSNSDLPPESATNWIRASQHGGQSCDLIHGTDSLWADGRQLSHTQAAIEWEQSQTITAQARQHAALECGRAHGSNSVWLGTKSMTHPRAASWWLRQLNLYKAYVAYDEDELAAAALRPSGDQSSSLSGSPQRVRRQCGRKCIGISGSGERCKNKVAAARFTHGEPVCNAHLQQASGEREVSRPGKSAEAATDSGEKQSKGRSSLNSAKRPSDMWINDDDPRAKAAAPMVRALREKLLEGLTRGSLINLTHSPKSRTHVRVVDLTLDQAYERIAGANTGPCEFVSLDEPRENPRDEATAEFTRHLEIARRGDEDYAAAEEEFDQDDIRTQKQLAEAERKLRDKVREGLGMPRRLLRDIQTPAQIARAQRIDPSYDLTSEGRDDNAPRRLSLQTLQYPREMTARLNSLRTGANRALEESGNNALHTVFAFLEWYPSDQQNRAIFSPIVMSPVEFDRNVWQTNRRFVIRGEGDDAFVNPALQVRLAQRENIVLPDLNENELPSQYIARIQPLFQSKQNWKVRTFLTVGLFESSLITIWRDLDPDMWPGNANPASHQVIADLLAGSGDRVGAVDEIYAIDSPAIVQKLPEPILDADSSQLSALLDVLDGKNIAIQGPPGTGKSQTIANIIAAAMSQGKSVLFVAEKMAALEVVKKRLDDVGLGDFILELHSTKVRAANVYQSFENRLTLASRLRAGEEYEEKLVDLRKVKTELNNYVHSVNSHLGTTGLTVHQAMWRLRVLEDPNLSTEFRRIEIPNAAEIDRATREEILTGLRRYRELRLEVDSEPDDPHRPDWHFVHQALTPQAQSRLRDDIASLLENLIEVRGSIDQLRWTGFEPGKELTVESINRIRLDLARSLEKAPSAQIAAHLAAYSSGVAVGDAQRYLDQSSVVAESQQKIDDVCTDQGLDPTVEELASILDALKEFGCTTVTDLTDKWQAIAARIKKMNVLRDGLDAVLGEMGLTFELSGENIQVLNNAFILVEKHEFTVLQLRSSNLRSGKLASAHAEASAIAHSALQRLADLSHAISIPQKVDAHDLKSASDSLRTAGMVGFLKPSVKRAKKLWLDLFGQTSSPDRQTMSNDLEILSEAINAMRAINDNQVLSEVENLDLRGIDTDFDSLKAAIELVESAGLIISRDVDAARAIRQFIEESETAHLVRVINLKNDVLDLDLTIAAELARPEILGELIQKLETSRSRLDLAIETSGQKKLNGDASVPQLEQATAGVRDLRSARQSLTQLANFSEAMMASGVDVDAIAQLRNGVDAYKFIESVEAELWPGFANKLIGSSPLENLAELTRNLDDLGRALESAESMIHEIGVLLETDTTIRDLASGSETIDDLEASLRAAYSSGQMLVRWCRMIAARDQLSGTGTSDVLRLCDEAIEPLDVEKVWEFVYWRTALNGKFGPRSVLRYTNGTYLTEARGRLKKLDAEIKGLAQRALAAQLSRKKAPWGNSIGRVRDLTERALIEHLSTQERPRVKVRDFLNRAGTAASALKPCFMMSPASVARYLPRGGTQFDIVIMDEASQIRTEEAIGSLARGSQAVIVGDTKQLPPTSFFQRIGLDDEEYEDVSAESMLDQALSRMPSRTLLWHYRSEHEDLIKFSNYHFYDNNLIVFPAAVSARSSHKGVHLKYVPDALYQGSTGRRKGGFNPAQAEEVASMAIRAMEEHPEHSLGVVAVNKMQADLIDETVYSLLQQSPKARQFYNTRAGTLEPFFVKNLENVQGDERDRIIVSTVYGPAQIGGSVRQAFGPIGGEHGHRRLNVLFTRARKRIDVVSSMSSADIKPTVQSKQGIRTFKAYHEFAASGLLAGLDYGVRGDPESDFENSVGSALAAQGFEVEYQVGVSGYRIDMGVKHSDFPHGYISGIECDGATYHSSYSARDRDLLRQQQLERLGWDIYRVWSTDWFEDPEGELEKLIQHLFGRLEIQRAIGLETADADDSESIGFLGVDHGADGDLSASAPVKGTEFPEHETKYTNPGISDFENSVGDALVAQGFEIDYQVAVSAYRIDIGVKHSEFSDGYIAGIECDGAPLLDNPTIRSRSQLRQQQIESQGWDIYGIWSADWFENPESELEKLLQYLSARLKLLRVSASNTNDALQSESIGVREVDDGVPRNELSNTLVESADSSEPEIELIHPVISESSIMKMGYDPSIERGSRWAFIRYKAVPGLTREGVINNLFVLASYYADFAPEFPEILDAIEQDLRDIRASDLR